MYKIWLKTFDPCQKIAIGIPEHYQHHWNPPPSKIKNSLRVCQISICPNVLFLFSQSRLNVNVTWGARSRPSTTLVIQWQYQISIKPFAVQVKFNFCSVILNQSCNTCNFSGSQNGTDVATVSFPGRYKKRRYLINYTLHEIALVLPYKHETCCHSVVASKWLKTQSVCMLCRTKYYNLNTNRDY